MGEEGISVAMMRGTEACSCTVRPNQQVRNLSGEEVGKNGATHKV